MHILFTLAIFISGLALPFLGSSDVLLGTGTINQLDQWKATTTPYTAVTTNVFGKNIYVPTSTATTSKIYSTTYCINNATPNCIDEWPSGGSGSGTGNVSTSTSETAGHIPYWTSTAGSPATLGSVATTSLTATSPLSLSNAISVIGSSASALSLDTSGTWTGNAGTASALAANGANCSSGSAPLGVDASGAVESCFDVWTEAENTSAAYLSSALTNGYILRGSESGVAEATSTVFIADSQRVGIGTTSPTGKLTVNGALQVSGDATSPTYPTTGEGFEFVYDTDGSYTSGSGGSGVSIFQSYSRASSAWRDVQFKGNNLGFYSDNTVGLRVLNNGNVYIGSGEPNNAHKLVVLGSTNGTDTTTFSVGNLNATDPSMYFSVGNGKINFQSRRSHPMAFSINLNEYMRIETDGNVGIGTTSPFAKLSVTNTGTAPSFIVEDSTSPDATPFIIDASGNVGIGAINPLVSLQVSGTTNVGTGWVNTSTDDAEDATLSITGDDATHELVASDAGTVGSIIGLKQVDGTVYENAWGIYRQTNGDGAGDGSLRFSYGTNVNPGANTDMLTISTTGSVGIGAAYAATADLKIFNTTPSIILQRGTASTGTDWQILNNSTGQFQLIPGYDGTTNGAFRSAAITIDGGTSNLGIGTTSPYAKLSVAGNGAFDGNLLASTFTATSTATSSIAGALTVGGNFVVDDGASATSTVSIGDVGNVACIKARDSDDLGWSYMTVLNGVATWSTTSCE